MRLRRKPLFLRSALCHRRREADAWRGSLHRPRRVRSRPGRNPTRSVQDDPQTLAATYPPAAELTLFEKLFGRSRSAILEKLYGPSPSGVRLAYAAPLAGLIGDDATVTTGLYDRQTAVYDISAHAVYLPNGTILEAHSGYHELLDDPRSASARSCASPAPTSITLNSVSGRSTVCRRCA